MIPKAIILLSGGLDSATCLALTAARGYECHTLSFDYGQKQRAELKSAQQVSAHFGATHHVLSLPTTCFSGSALTSDDISVPSYSGDKEIPTTYVPARNTIFLSMALGLAEVHDASTIVIGSSIVDYSGYPDCRPEYLQAFEKMANLATKSAIEGKRIHIDTPLLYLSKAQTILLGNRLGVDYSQTITCYQADEKGNACGICDSCTLRKRGFTEAGVPDPTRYRR